MARVLWCAVMLMVPMGAFAQPKVATPTFSVAGGEHASLVLVVVRVKTPGATIRLTQNGADPTDADPIVSSEATIVVRASTVLKARAFLAGRRPSDVRTAAFTILEAPALGPGDADAGGARSILAIPSGRVIEWRGTGEPQIVDELSGVTAVSAGAGYALALTHEGHLYGWGVNAAGQLGDGTGVRRKAPVRIPGLSNVVRIAAGRSHSLALTADGRVWAWGANGNGQLGIGTPGNRRVPTMVPALADIVAIDAGNAHSIAMTRAGEVFTWGANGHGQLGDGTRKKRAQPVRIALTGVAQIAAGATHTLALRRDGSVHAWGSGARGELGTGAQADSTRPTAIGGLLAVAIRAGRRFSAAVRPDGMLMTWGANESGQLGDGSRVDRLVPVQGPALRPISALSLGGRHAVAVTDSGDVWTWGRTAAPSESISEVAAWGPPIAAPPPVPTVSAPPHIAPPAGVYTTQQMVAITTNQPDVTLRYTLDGSDPTAASPAYAAPFTVSANTTIKARAFAQTAGINPSSVVTVSYIIDAEPPSITAHVSPVLTGAWHTTPVTVTFQCSDDSGTVSCPPPIVVSQDGASQVISGTAIDAAGRQATAAVTVSIDRTPPSVVLTESPDGTTTTATQVLLTGHVVDTLSGLAGALRCNGAVVNLAPDTFECLVTLTPGRNTVTLQAQDMAGNVAAAGIVVTRGGTPTRLAMTPDTRTMVLDDVAPVSLRDEFGVVIPDAEWTSSDPAVAVVVDRGSPFVVPMGLGTAVISATKGDLTAASTVTVDPAATLPTGTLRWSVSPSPGATMEAPIFTHRVDASVPHMFLVEAGATGPATLRAATAEGDVLWNMEAPGIPLMGDTFGSVIVGVPYTEFSRFEFKALVRIGGGVVPPWRYESPGVMQRPAQAADGTIYVVEVAPTGTDIDGTERWEKFAVTIDGRNGSEVGRYLFPRDVETFKATVETPTGDPCANSRIEELADHVGPVAGSANEGYVLMRRRQRHVHTSCSIGPDWPTRTIDNAVDLLVLSPGAAPVVQPLFDERCVIPTSTRAGCDQRAGLTQLMPDGIGGVLAHWGHGILSNGRLLLQEVITRRTATGSLEHRPMADRMVLHSVGQNGLLYAWTNESTMALDVTSWTPKWMTFEDDRVLPVAAHPDGGIAADRGEISLIDNEGQLIEVVPGTMGLTAPIQAFNSWIGIRDGQLHVVAGEYPDATRFAPQIGNGQRQLAPRTPGLGIFAKSHPVISQHLNFDHVSIRVTPTFQDFWQQMKPADFVNKDEYGNYFMTIGAGAGGDDSSLFCIGTLTKGINRTNDVHTKPVSFEQLPMGIFDEMRVINDLFVAFAGYNNDLPYACVPEMSDTAYNSNSFASGILLRVGAPLPIFPTRGVTVPGWGKPVPAFKFDP